MSVGLPSTTIEPLSRIIALSQISISSGRSCPAIIIVLFIDFSRLIVFLLQAGSRLAEGSSNIKMFGFIDNTVAIATRCFSPMDR